MEQPFVERSLLPLAFRPFRLERSAPKVGWLISCGSKRIASPGSWTSFGPTWPSLDGSGALLKGGSVAPTGSMALIPLAFLLDDERLKGKARRWMDYIIEHQHHDGWLGPVRSPEGRYQAYDPWPSFVILKAMIQYYEATGDERIPREHSAIFAPARRLLDEKPLFEWGKSRWADLVLSIHWMYRRFGRAMAPRSRGQGKGPRV